MPEPALKSSATFDKFEIIKTGIVNLPSIGPGSGTHSIAHGLNFVPVPFVFIDDGSSLLPLPTFLAYNDTGSDITFSQYLTYYVDETNLTIRAILASGQTSLVFPLRYYLCRYSAK